MPRLPSRHLTATSIFVLFSALADAEPIPRALPAAGSVVAAKGGEELRFVREESWRGVELKQSLVSGDALRTNSIGNLAILFADQTQIRVGRNSTLVVNDIASGQTNTQLELQSGQVWARAARGGSGVDVKTPAAVAAIRGTDWSLSVDGSGKTSLLVLEGVVELRNAQGSVTVRQGEGAVAAIGQKPTKFVLVSPSDREQMLFYLSLRSVFTHLPATLLDGQAALTERARLEAIPPGSRRVEDWLSLAEIAHSTDTRTKAAAALAEARRGPMSAAQRARADLVEGLLAGAERRWSDATVLFAKAERGLDPHRRARAAYARYAAASLADPKRVLPEPHVPATDPRIAEIRAYVTGFRNDLSAAAAEAREAEKRFPRDAGLARFSAEVAALLDRRDDMRAAYQRARAIDPNDPSVLAMGASIKADYDRDLEGALADLYRSVELVPSSGTWNDIGLILESRDAPIESEAAFRRAIALDPEDPIAYGNLAILLLDQSRVDEAGALIDTALAADPSNPAALTFRGRYLLQKGDMAAAQASMLAGSAANPAASDALLALADSYFQNGELELADQALDNADRLDPHAAIVSILRTAFALDAYRADDAILAAREALRRSRARGGDFAGISVSRQSGSYPVEAYRFINLHDWARYYADRTFDPFQATGYLDQAIVSRPGVFVTKPTLSTVEGVDVNSSFYSLQVQGLLLDPLAVSGRIGRYDPLRRPFLDAEIGAGVIARGSKLGWEQDATVNGFTNTPFPTSFTFGIVQSHADGDLSSDRESVKAAAFSVGIAPSAADRFLIQGSASRVTPALVDLETDAFRRNDDQTITALQGVAGWSHSFGYKNILSAAVFGVQNTTRQLQERTDFGSIFNEYNRLMRKDRFDGGVAAINHSIGFGDLTLRYGIETQAGQLHRNAVLDTRFDYWWGQQEFFQQTEQGENPFRGGRAYADASWRPNDWFEAQAGIHRTFMDLKGVPSESWISPRFGIGVSPIEGQWLRAAYIESAEPFLSQTLSPIATVGLIPNDLPAGGQTDTLALRWDAEWSPRFFTSLEYQRQSAHSLNVPILNTVENFAIDKARTDWVAATANLWLGYGIGIFGTVGGAESEIRSGDGLGEPVPYVPDRFARAGITFVHPSRLRFTLTETYVGERSASFDNFRLDGYWTTDAAITWETPDRRLLLGLTALNLFDTKYELAFNVPGPSRTVAATLKARF